MKKVLTLFLVLTMGLLTISCSMGGHIMIDSQREIANQKIEKILEAIELKNVDMLTSLFSMESIQKVEAFDKTVGELFGYFNGEVESYDDWGGPYVETSRENGHILQIMEISCDVKTSRCGYRIALRCITRDTANDQNIGIHSMYIIRLEDDLNQKNAYWGDGKNTPGINIGIPST